MDTAGSAAGPGLDEMLADTWARLARGVADRRAPARHPVLATVGRDGTAEARVLVLRRADPGEGVIELHTDTASAKAAEIAERPGVTVLVWDDRARLQIRLRARAALLTGEAAARAWARVPEPARTVYGAEPAPGHEIARPEDHRPAADRDRFAVIRCRVEEIELLHLGPERHRRARFARSDRWAGRWIAP